MGTTKKGANAVRVKTDERGHTRDALVQPKAFFASEMEEGLRFAIREGGRTVGAGVVAKIIA
ncbi:hypothetical protein [Hydrogenophaga sp. NH-16]|uniref:EF-Tu C-terminal domain-related protein n=1 Tax=Hydrogenophaga sp. NH-16 TaxID=2184519 RepID=UPI000FD731FC|nr:hypothetical protein [Hydrogenophaga sp. NH-16]